MLALRIVLGEDTWLRPITNRTHLKKNGKLHHSALVGALDPPENSSQPWSHELSGRLLSIATDIVADAQRRVQRQREANPDAASIFDFHAVVHIVAEQIRKWAAFRADL